MEHRPEVIRHGRCGRVLRITSPPSEVAYLVMVHEPERRRRFKEPAQAMEYLAQLERT